MAQIVTQDDIKKEWKDISIEAYRRAERTNDQFNKDLVQIGAAFTALSALLVYVKPDLTGIAIATGLPLFGALIAHIKNYKEEHLYKAFASHALDMRDAECVEDTHKKLPRIDQELVLFQNSESYKNPSTLSCLSHFRTAIIGITAGTALTVVGGFSEKGYGVISPYRNEDEETSSEENSPPHSSLRPVPRPQIR